MNNQIQPREEIDLLQFFKAIGAFFKQIYQGVLRILKNILFLIFHVLIYFKKNALYLGAGILAGLILAFVLQKNYQKVYKASVFTKVNFEASPDLEGKLESFNALIENEEYEVLAKELNIETEQAKQLRHFDWTPVVNKVLLLKDYAQYHASMDTTVSNKLTFQEYIKDIKNAKSLSPYYRLTVTAYSPDIFQKLNPALEKLLEDNPVLIEKKKEFLSFAFKKKEKLHQALSEVDSLRKVFNKVYLNSSEKATASGVVVNTAHSTGYEKPYDLFETRLNLLKELKKNEEEIAVNKHILFLYNNFPERGMKTNQISYNPFLQYPLFGFFFVLIILLLKELNVLLKQYEKKLKEDEKN